MMLTIVNQPHTVYRSVAAAQAVVDKIAAHNIGPADDAWTYRVVPDPKGSGRATIEVADETGARLGLL